MKKVLAIFGVVVLLGALVVGLGVFGIVKIPGLSHVKKPKLVASKDVQKPAPAPVPKPPPAPPKKNEPPVNTPKPVKETPEQVIDPTKGAESVAGLWNEMDPNKVMGIVADWKDADVATVFRQMDPDKVAGILSILPPKRASRISALVEKQASEAKDES